MTGTGTGTAGRRRGGISALEQVLADAQNAGSPERIYCVAELLIDVLGGLRTEMKAAYDEAEANRAEAERIEQAAAAVTERERSVEDRAAALAERESDVEAREQRIAALRQKTKGAK